jgi:protein HEXIM1/2
MTEVIETRGAIREPEMEERKGGGVQVRGDPNKRRSTEEVTSGEIQSKKTKYNNVGNSARNKNRRRNKNKNRCGRNIGNGNVVASSQAAFNVNTNGFKHRRGSKNKKRGHFAQKQLKENSTQASPGSIVNVPSNKTNGNTFSSNDFDGPGPFGIKPIQAEKTIRHRKHTLSNNAPFNSTQFLMKDHENDPNDAIQFLDSALGVRRKEANSAASSVHGERPVRKINRARDSSFSLDSDEEFYYSSPEDEEEFVNQEFMKEYDNCRSDRLVDMPKGDLIQEYLVLENRVDSLEKRLNHCKDNTNLDTPPDTSPETTNNDLNSEVSEKIKKFQRQILRLESENERLRQMMQNQSSEPSINDVHEPNHSAINDVLMEGTPSDDDTVSSCSTCNTKDSSSSSSSSSSGSSTPSIDEEVEEDHIAEYDADQNTGTNYQDTSNHDHEDEKSNGQLVDTSDAIPAKSSDNVLSDTIPTENLEEIESDENKENAEVVECSEQVSENFVSSTGP